MNKKVNKDEIRAKKYLQTLEYTYVEYEPLGNVTPDFLLDKKIAVEVRRLNRNYIKDKNLISIENLEIHLIKSVKKLIETFKCNPYSNSSHISITLSKPASAQDIIGINKRVKRILKKHSNKISKEKSYHICDFLSLRFTPVAKESKIYTYTECNEDSLWIIHALHKHIQEVINEKNKKIEKNFSLYEEWWLLLVDSIVYGLDNEDFEKLKQIQLNKHKFTKVIILSPKGSFDTFEF